MAAHSWLEACSQQHGKKVRAGGGVGGSHLKLSLWRLKTAKVSLYGLGTSSFCTPAVRSVWPGLLSVSDSSSLSWTV